jgi:hypothetical protein
MSTPTRRPRRLSIPHPPKQLLAAKVEPNERDHPDKRNLTYLADPL